MWFRFPSWSRRTWKAVQCTGSGLGDICTKDERLTITRFSPRWCSPSHWLNHKIMVALLSECDFVPTVLIICRDIWSSVRVYRRRLTTTKQYKEENEGGTELDKKKGYSSGAAEPITKRWNPSKICAHDLTKFVEDDRVFACTRSYVRALKMPATLKVIFY